MRPSIIIIALSLLLPGAGQAQKSGSAAMVEPPPARERSAEAIARFPQPVRVGDLIGRQVLQDSPQQRVLGRIAAVSRAGDGSMSILMDRRGWLGFGGSRVALPMEATALLGPFLVLRGLDGEALAALPDISAEPRSLLGAEAVVRIGLGRN